VSDASAALGAAWGQATSAWWALMAGSWTAVDAVVRAILETSYEEADITRVNEVEFDVPAGVDATKLKCEDLIRIAPGPPQQPFKGGNGTITPVPSAAGAAATRATLVLKPVGAVTGDYVALLVNKAVTPHQEVGRVVVFVLG
jgi:hypothetical protein